MFRIIVSTAIAIVFLNATLGAADTTPEDTADVKQLFGNLPLYFIENQGQIDCEDVACCVKGADKTLYFTSEGITFSLKGEGNERWTVKLNVVGANPIKPIGQDKQEALFSYFKGKPEDWKKGLPAYSELVYEDLRPGIDLVYFGTVNRLKYEFVVEPSANPDMIRLEYSGATDVTITEAGALIVTTPVGRLADDVPYAYQMIDGKRKEVSIRYALGNVGIGANEFHTHLYHLGNVIPGGKIQIKVVGDPGTKPVRLALGSGIQDPPQPTPYGDLYLTLPPARIFNLVGVPSNGVRVVLATVPASWQSGESYPFQALVGPLAPGSVLSNLMVMTVD